MEAGIQEEVFHLLSVTMVPDEWRITKGPWGLWGMGPSFASRGISNWLLEIHAIPRPSLLSQNGLGQAFFGKIFGEQPQNQMAVNYSKSLSNNTSSFLLTTFWQGSS